MSFEPSPALSDFAEFAAALRGQREEHERIVRLALRRVGHTTPDAAQDDLQDVSRALESTLGDLDRAAEELCVQNEALFAARVELEGASAMFRDLFELAPSAYVVTREDTQIMYANEAACALLQRTKNALAGKPLIAYVPLEERSAFRSAVVRTNESDAVSEWHATLLPSGTSTSITCRMRIRPVLTVNM